MTASKRTPISSLVLITLVLGLNLGCTRSSKPAATTSDDDTTRHLSFSSEGSTAVPGTILTETEALGSPNELLLVGDYLVVSDDKGEQPLHLLQASDGSFVRGLGRFGEGPGEFAGSVSLQKAMQDEQAFWAYDAQLYRLTYIDLAAYLSGDDVLGERMVHLTPEGYLFKPTWINDSLIVSNGMLSEGRLIRYDDNGKSSGLVGVTPPGEDKIPIPMRQHAYQSTLRTNSSRTRVALGTRHADQLEIYEPDGTRLVVVRGSSPFEPKYVVRDRGGRPSMTSGDDMRFGYIDLATTEDYIFALYSGRTRGEYPGRANFGDTIHVFDWSGQFIHAYALDADVISITVDETGSALFASRHRPHPAILTYPLTEH